MPMNLEAIHTASERVATDVAALDLADRYGIEPVPQALDRLLGAVRLLHAAAVDLLPLEESAP